MIDPNIFRAYDIRGVYGETLTKDIMKKIGVALSEKFSGKKFLVGNDIRASSEKLASALIAGLGKNVTYVGTTAFGETLLAGSKLNHDVTLYITASHLPPEWNGVKLYYGDGEAFPSELIYELRDSVIKSDVQRRCFNEDYVKFMKESFKPTPLKVIVDCGNGSTCLSAPKVFKELGFDVTILNGNVDPSFPAHTADIKPKDLTVLREKVLSEEADFGAAFDGDGDRFILIDERGDLHRSDRVGIMLAKHMLPSSKKNKVIVALPVSMAAETELKPLGADVIRVPVGHTFVINGCKENDAIIGMEESGHLVLADYCLFDDALLAPLKIAEIMCETSKKLSELASEIPSYPFDEIVFDCSDDKKFEFIEKLANKLAKEYKNVSTLDGLRIDFGDGWILLRASNTSPKIRLYIEATSREKFNELEEKFVGLIKGELE
jgi:phosphomannomutase